MTTATAQPTTTLEPFFADGRAVIDRLHATRRDWIPTKAGSESPELLAGLVLEVGSYVGLNDKVSPTLRILDGDGIEWSCIGFHGFLRAEISRQKPRVGDWVAVAFNGTKPATKAGESDSFVYRLIVERNPDAPAVNTVPPVEATVPDEPVASGGGMLDPDQDIPF